MTEYGLAIYFIFVGVFLAGFLCGLAFSDELVAKKGES